MKRRVAKDIPWNCSQNNQVGFLFVVSNYSIFHISVNPERKTNPGKLCWGTEGLIYRIYCFHRGLSSSLPHVHAAPTGLSSASGHSVHSPLINIPELWDSITSQLMQVSKSPSYLTCTPDMKFHYWRKIDKLILCAHIFTGVLKEKKKTLLVAKSNVSNLKY